jgi:predicted DNA-binding transcriptional regulator AlpA
MTDADKPAIEPLMTEEQAAEHLGVSENALYRLRRSGGGPKFVIVGKIRIRYSPSAIRAWLADREVSSMAEFYAANRVRAAEADKQRKAAAIARKTRHLRKEAETVVT